MKCEQCGFLVDSLPEGGGEYLCPNCGWVMRKGAPESGDDETPSGFDPTASASHLKIAKTVNVGFGDFASVLAATDVSKIVSADDRDDVPERTRTASASTLTVADPDDDAMLPLDVYDEDDEYARIQAEIAGRKASLDARAAELDARESYLNRKLEEIIAEKEFLRTGIEKSDLERASYLKLKEALDAQRSDMEKEMAARKASLDARAAEIERKSEALAKTRAALEDLKRELDTSMTGNTRINDDDPTTSSVSIPYSAKLLRRNNKLERTVRILKIALWLGILFYLILIALYCDLIRKTERQKTEWNRMIQQLTSEQTEAAASAATGGEDGAVSGLMATPQFPFYTTTNEQHPVPEPQTSGGGL